MFPITLKSLTTRSPHRRSGPGHRPRGAYQPRLETLEDRQLLSVSIIDIGTLPGGTFSRAMAVNNLGHVTGYGDAADGKVHGFLWKDGQMTDLGTVGGQESGPYAINDEDQIVGDVQTPDGTRAFLWTDGVLTQLNLPNSNQVGGRAAAWGVNNLGQVVGAYINAGDPAKTPHAYLWQNGVETDIPNTLGLGGVGDYAYDIRDNGDIVGFGMTADGGTRPFFAHAATDHQVRMVNIGTLGGDRGRAYRINDHGQIIGSSSEGGRYDKSFLYDQSTQVMTGLGTLGGAFSYAWDINDNGYVVGTSFMSPPQIHAYIDINFNMIDLNSLLPDNYWSQLTEARQINNSDQIVGYGYHNHQYHGYLLNYDTSDSASVGNFSGLVTGTDSVTASPASTVALTPAPSQVTPDSPAVDASSSQVQTDTALTTNPSPADLSTGNVGVTDSLANPVSTDGSVAMLT